MKRLVKKLNQYGILIGIGLTLAFLWGSHAVLEYTSSDNFCAYCHVHPHATEKWKLSTHYKNESGVVVHCIQCHLPPKGVPHYTEKIRVGLRDVYGTLFKDVSKIDWAAKRRLEYARTYTFDEACTHCHAELFSLNLSRKGEDAHVYYFHQKGVVRCINCHLHVGHFFAETVDSSQSLAAEAKIEAIPRKPFQPGRFENFTEEIPGTGILFEMVAIPGGVFEMGSPESEALRQPDEGPVRRVHLDSFWMGKAEVSWREWDAFYVKTATMGKEKYGDKVAPIDAITGPTPPYGSPDQGWGKGRQPAITMTHYAARRYCEWLSQATGATYRLPTEAEWEYASRGGTTTPYFFPGEPEQFSRKNWLSKITGIDTTGINRHAWYLENSHRQTHPVNSKHENPFGLLNLYGNVREFCLDWYAAYPHPAGESPEINPLGPATGTEHVLRGGSFRSDAAELRSAARDFTRSDKWFLTDPQSPKSLWWYSDCNDVGFRIVREWKREMR